MLPCRRADERVIDGPARDAEADEIPAELDRLLLTQERRRREVVGQEADFFDGRTRREPGRRVRTEYVSNQAWPARPKRRPLTASSVAA